MILSAFYYKFPKAIYWNCVPFNSSLWHCQCHLS